MAVSFAVGDSFASFSALEEHMQKYKAEKFVEFWKRDSMTIEDPRRGSQTG